MGNILERDFSVRIPFRLLYFQGGKPIYIIVRKYENRVPPIL